MTLDLDDLERKARAATSEVPPNDGDPLYECLACRGHLFVEDGLDPSPLCHGCAHGHASALGAGVLALIARVRTLENALTEALDGWQDAMRLAPDDRRTPGERRDEVRIATLRGIAAGKAPR